MSQIKPDDLNLRAFDSKLILSNTFSILHQSSSSKSNHKTNRIKTRYLRKIFLKEKWTKEEKVECGSDEIVGFNDGHIRHAGTSIDHKTQFFGYCSSINTQIMFNQLFNQQPINNYIQWFSFFNLKFCSNFLDENFSSENLLMSRSLRVEEFMSR